MASVSLRPATVSDAADIAILDNIAGHGISLWFWQREVESGLPEDAFALGRQRLGDPNVFYGFSNAYVATEDDIILGSVTSYVMPPPDAEDDAMKKEASAFTPVFELFETIIDDWFIDSLAVYPQARGKGIGALLLDFAVERGLNGDHSHASLLVEDSNIAACNLYAARGFEITNQKKYVEFRGPSETNNWLLMRKTY